MAANADQTHAIARETFKDANHGRVVAYNPRMVRAIGSLPAAAMLAQLMWMGTDNGEEDDEGWFKVGVERIERETGISRDSQQTATKTLKALNLIEVEKRGLPASNYWRINYEQAQELYNQQIVEELQTAKARKAAKTRQYSTSPGTTSDDDGGSSTSQRDPRSLVNDPQNETKKGIDSTGTSLTSQRGSRSLTIYLEDPTDLKERERDPRDPPEQTFSQPQPPTAPEPEPPAAPPTNDGLLAPDARDVPIAKALFEKLEGLGVLMPSVSLIDYYVNLVPQFGIRAVLEGFDRTARRDGGVRKLSNPNYVLKVIEDVALAEQDARAKQAQPPNARPTASGQSQPRKGNQYVPAPSSQSKYPSPEEIKQRREFQALIAQQKRDGTLPTLEEKRAALSKVQGHGVGH